MLKIGSHMDVRRVNGMGIRGATSYHSGSAFRGGDSSIKSQDLRPTTNIPLARSGTVNTGLMVKQAQSSQGTTFTPPGFYSPYHTPSSWQVPTNRHEVYRWCLHPDTLVTMADFTQKPISKIEVGDSVLTSEGTSGLVTVTSARSYEGDLKSIEVVGVPGTIKATPDHIFYRVKEESLACKYFRSQFRYCRQKHACTAKNCSDHETLEDRIEIEECRADELREGDFLYSPTDVLHGERRDYSPELMRLFGYYLAEGYVALDNRSKGEVPAAIIFSFGKGEADGIVADCTEIISNEFDYEAGTPKSETAHQVAIYSREIARMFFDLMGSGSLKKRLSPELLCQAPDLLRELVIGYFLGDGGKAGSGGESAFTSVNYDLLSQIKLILEGMGIASRLAGDEKELGDHEVGKYHKLYVAGVEANSLFLDSSYQNYKTAQVKRRQNNLRSIKVGAKRFYRISGIENLPYSGPVHDMRVDDEFGTHRFVANTIVVSNCSFWIDNEPRVSAAIDFYSDFPVSAGYELECPNASVKEFFEKLCKKLKLEEKLPRILREYFGMGDAFVMLNLDCQKCGGSGMDENGEECEHEGAVWSHLSVLDPTTIEVMPFSHLTDEPEIYMLPNNELAKIVSTGKPEHLYERLSDDIKRLVKSRRPMKLDPLVVTHFKHGASDYQVYGKSIIRRLFPTLAYKDKLRQANWLIAERHAVPIKIVKIGSDQRPASQEDIWDVQERLSEVANDPLLTFVTHHAFDYEWVGASGKVLQLTSEFELIENEMIDGFGLSKAILSGEGPTYANAQIGVEVIARRLEGVQRMIGEWLSEKVFKPIAKFNGFVAKSTRGETEYIYPTVKFNDLRLRDDNAKLQNMWNTRQAGDLSLRRWLTALDIDMDEEIENLRNEDLSAILASPDLGIASGPVSGGGYAGGGGGAPDMGGMPPMDMGGGMPPPGGDMGGGPPGGDMGGAPPDGGAPPGGMPMPSAASLVGSYRKVYGEAAEIRSRVISAAKLDDNAWMFRGGGRLTDVIDRGDLVLGHGYRGPLESDPDMGLLYEAVTPYWGRPGISYLDWLLQGRTAGDVREQILEKYVKFAEKEDQKRLPTAREFFTKLEHKLIAGVAGMRLPYQMWAQWLVNGDPHMRVDVAFPQLRIAVEADGRKWHADPESMQKDRNRDAKLAAQGWMVLRFREDEINDRMEDVVKVISKAINQRVQGMGVRTAATVASEGLEVAAHNLREMEIFAASETATLPTRGAAAWL
jgi:very-short-patch-repair endonuclease/intein/homing endonuclease